MCPLSITRAGENKEELAIPVPVGANVGMTRIPIPTFFEDKFCMYMDEIEMWKEVCGLPKTKQGMVLLLDLHRDSPSNIKEIH